MSPGRIVALGAAFGGAAVVLGAFGAHGLRARVTPEMLAIFETAVRYHFYHALALVLVGLFAARAVASPGGAGGSPLSSLTALCFTLGIVIFSGSLYLLVFSGMRWLGAITPLGGLAFIVGWALFAFAALRG
jgi:uncharacterized membrane protein YgdD (TMEM256/DUF423 family)